MLSRMKEEYKVAMLLSLESGLRVSDVLCLTYGQALGFTPLTEKKTKKEVTLRLPRYVQAILLDRLTRVPNANNQTLVFPSQKNPEKPLNRSTLYRAVKKAAAEMGIRRNVSPHTARKIYAVEIYRATGDLNSVKENLRHDEMATTLLYAFSDKLQQFSD